MADSVPPEEHGSKTSEVKDGVSALPMKTLRGKRLVLKPPSPEDDGPLSVIFSDSITMQYLPQHQRPDGWTVEDMSARRLQQEDEFLQGKRITFSIHVLESTTLGDEVSTVAGAAGYRLNGDDTGEFGIIVHHPYWRKGLNTEAAYLLLKYGFEILGVKQVDWVTRKDNAPMRKWCESLSMAEYEVLTLEMGESAGYSLSATEWRSRVCRLLEQRLS